MARFIGIILITRSRFKFIIIYRSRFSGYKSWSEALIIYSIYKYIALLINFRNIIGISRVLLNFYKVKTLKNKAFISYIKSIISRF